MGYETGFYYTTFGTSTSSTNAGNQNVYYTPFYVFETKTFDRIAVRTQSTFSGTATVRLGIYNNDSTTAKPSTVSLDAGTVSCTTASTTYEITISKTLTKGWYWLAMCTQGAATTNAFFSAGNILGFQNTKVTSTFSNMFTTNVYLQTGVSGAFATATSLTMAGANVLVFLRAA
jgi:hypothetical protein